MVLPVGRMQEVPGQQSALVVHPLPHPTQLVVLQTKGGLPLGLGTHGLPLQQSALVAHALPPSWQFWSAHRGTPTLSRLQAVLAFPRPAQQSWFALHDMVMSLQTSPFGVQPMCCWQKPPMHATGWPEVGRPASMRASDPQQSSSVMHVSPSTWHPVAGWQMSTPVGPHGAHRRLQQLPPHPPSAAGEKQSWPSAAEQFPPNVNWPQVPMVLPVATVHVPTQQSVLAWHASPD